MKGMRLFAVVCMIFFILTDGTQAAFAATETESARVVCRVEPKYSFTLPCNFTVRYPGTRTEGTFGVGELLLESGERLKVFLYKGELRGTGNNGAMLPYSVSFHPPAFLDATESRNAYEVRVTIRPEDFNAVPAGIYKADLKFQVESNRSESSIWQGTAVLTAWKPSAAAGSVQPPGKYEGGPGFGLGKGIYWWWIFPAAGGGAFAVWFFMRKRFKERHGGVQP